MRQPTAFVDPYTEDERERIIDAFRSHRSHYYAFVFHQFWTGARPSEAVALRWSQMDVTYRRIRIRGSRVLGRDGSPKTGKSKRDVVIHGNLLDVLREHGSMRRAKDDFVFTTPGGAPINQVNFYAREWVPMLQRLGVRLRPFYNARHTYITYLLSLGVSPLFVVRQTGTSLEMIEAHYGGMTAVADELDARIQGREKGETGNLPGTPLPEASQQRKPAGKEMQLNPALSTPFHNYGDVF